MPITVTVLVFGRDVGILLVSALLYAAAGRREFRPSIFGKANTLAQIVAVAAVLLYPRSSRLVLDVRKCRARRHHGAHRHLRIALRMGSCRAAAAPKLPLGAASKE